MWSQSLGKLPLRVLLPGSSLMRGSSKAFSSARILCGRGVFPSIQLGTAACTRKISHRPWSGQSPFGSRFACFPLRALSTNILAQNERDENRENRDEPETPHKVIGAWLFACSGLVFGMVLLGGLTRLTKSGLSMTEWKPYDIKYPSTVEEWNEEFDKYKATPEYERENNDMRLEQFQFIYFMEYAHRLMGRGIGFAFGLPLLGFWALGKLKGQRALQRRLGLLFLLGGCQGAVGWWMVKSGIDLDPTQQGRVRVSPYRLATHLISATTIFALLLKTAMDQWTLGSVARGAVAAPLPPQMRMFRGMSIGLCGLVFVTVFSGAFVAGNGAGLVYNEFPLMGGRLIPSDIINPYLQPKWRNLFENHTTVQFNHRVLGMSTAALATGLWVVGRRAPLSQSSRVALRLVMGMTALQVTLGVSTLLLYVPVHLAATHQAGALTLLSLSLYLLHTLSPSPLKVAGAVLSSGSAASLAGLLLFQPEDCEPILGSIMRALQNLGLAESEEQPCLLDDDDCESDSASDNGQGTAC